MKVGIVTQYYKSINYGGNLQAYALCRVLNSLSSDIFAEQISYRKASWEKGYLSLSSKTRLKRFFGRALRAVKNKTERALHGEVYKGLSLRRDAVLKFNREKIPHSERVYSSEDIKEANACYDVFITGSDQVWSPGAFCTGYLLDFVEEGKVKLSYAPSISRDTLRPEEEAVFKKALKNYKAVSVREGKGVELLRELSPVNPICVLDPTQLLTAEDYDEICAPPQVKEPYAFAYFLGDDLRQRELATEFARKKGIKLVSIPYLHGKYRSCDMNFSDEKLCKVGIEEFISLIKYADYVLTDSFHATVFSNIYQKQYFVFSRVGLNTDSRIYGLLSVLETQERFLDRQERLSLDYMTALPTVDYSCLPKGFEEMREESIGFLRENLRVD